MFQLCHRHVHNECCEAIYAVSWEIVWCVFAVTLSKERDWRCLIAVAPFNRNVVRFASDTAALRAAPGTCGGLSNTMTVLTKPPRLHLL